MATKAIKCHKAYFTRSPAGLSKVFINFFFLFNISSLSTKGNLPKCSTFLALANRLSVIILQSANPAIIINYQVVAFSTCFLYEYWLLADKLTASDFPESFDHLHFAQDQTVFS